MPKAEMTPLTKIAGYGHVAVKYGMEEAVFLDAIMFWWRTNRRNDKNNYEGRWWTYNSVETYTDIFPWWSASQIRRIIGRCKDKGALLTANFNEDKRDRTVWYSPSDELLTLYGENFVTCICPNEQMQPSEGTNTSDEISEPLPCSYHVYDTPPIIPPEGDSEGERLSEEGMEISQAKYRPDWFNIFYDMYPVHKGRKAAIRAWDKLKPSLALCKVMEVALKRDMASPEWNEDGGAYRPHPASWLNGRRWEDSHDVQAQPPSDAPLRGEGVHYL